jgi:hypothetical protein
MPRIRTDFTQPAPVAGLAGAADPDLSRVTLTWDASAETYLEAYRIYHRDDAGVDRIVFQGGALEFAHQRARLGSNAYKVVVWNGALESEPVALDVALTARVPGHGVLLVRGSDRLIVDVMLDSLSMGPYQDRTVLRGLDGETIARKGPLGRMTGEIAMRIESFAREQTALVLEMAAGDDAVTWKDPHGRVLDLDLAPPRLDYQAFGAEGVSVPFDEIEPTE